MVTAFAVGQSALPLYREHGWRVIQFLMLAPMLAVLLFCKPAHLDASE